MQNVEMLSFARFFKCNRGAQTMADREVESPVWLFRSCLKFAMMRHGKFLKEKS
jgi:hypothetical protein